MTDDRTGRGSWEDHYRSGNTPWDLGRPAPPLERLFTEEASRLGSGPAAVLGCGRGHEPAALARRGVRVFGVDWSETALAAARREFPHVRYVRGDVRALPFRAGSIVTLVEHTCYCAIDPAWRPAYVREAARVLAPGGRLLGLFYEPEPPGDPPFAISAEDVRRDFARDFVVERLEKPADSTPHRAGREWLAVLRRRG